MFKRLWVVQNWWWLRYWWEELLEKLWPWRRQKRREFLELCYLLCDGEIDEEDFALGWSVFKFQFDDMSLPKIIRAFNWCLRKHGEFPTSREVDVAAKCKTFDDYLLRESTMPKQE